MPADAPPAPLVSAPDLVLTDSRCLFLRGLRVYCMCMTFRVSKYACFYDCMRMIFRNLLVLARTRSYWSDVRRGRIVK